MARIPPIRRLSQEDFPDQQSWIGRLFQPLNDFIENVVFALEGNLTFNDNMAANVRTLKVIGGQFPVDFQFTFRGRPIGLWVVNVQEDDASPAPVTNATTASWDYLGANNVRINNISGLTPGQKYTVTVVVIAG